MKKIEKIFSWLVIFLIVSAGVVYGADVDFNNIISKGCKKGNSKTVAWGCSIGLGTTTNMISTSTTSMSMNDMVDVGMTCKNDPTNSKCTQAANSTGLLQYALHTVENPQQYLTPPLSFQYYVNNKLDNTIISQSVYAKTFGGGALDVVYGVWQYMRNLAYLVFVVVIIFVGFMVMFRKQLDPRTVVTVQSAIPNFFIVLLLITFSYGIGSLAISSIGPLYQALKNVGTLGSANGTFVGLLVLFLGAVAYALFSTAALRMVGISVMIIFLVIIICILIAFILYGIEYIKRLAKLILLTVLGPIILLFGAIPGQGHFIGHWFKAIIANVLALPFMYFVLRVGLMLIILSGSGGNPSLNTVWFGFKSGLLHIIMGVVVMFWSAKIPKLVEEMFGYDGSLIPTDPKR